MKKVACGVTMKVTCMFWICRPLHSTVKSKTCMSLSSSPHMQLFSSFHDTSSIPSLKKYNNNKKCLEINLHHNLPPPPPPLPPPRLVLASTAQQQDCATRTKTVICN